MDHTLFHFNQKNLWRFLNLLFLTCIGLFGGCRFLGIASLKPFHILTALAAISIMTLISSMTLKSRFFGLAGILLALSGAAAAIGFQNCFSFLQSYFHWLIGNPVWNREQAAGYEIIQTIFLSLLCYLLQTVTERNFRIRLLVLLFLFLSLLYCLFAEREMSKVSVAFILCYSALIYTEWTQMRWKKEKTRHIWAYMLWITPFFALYFLLMLLPSVPEKPYDWQIVKNAYRQLRESFLKISYNFPGISSDDYDLSLSGFSEKSGLGSSSLETHRELMAIRSQTKPRANIYLTGKVYDTFNGREWIQQNEDTAKERYMDTLQTLYAIQRYDRDYQSDYLSQIEITVSYRYFRSEFLFAPLKASAIRQNSSGLSFRESGGSLFFDRRRGYGTEYELSFYQLNAGQEVFHQFLNNGKYPEYKEDELRSILRAFENRTKESITINDMQHYRQVIYDNYLEDITLSEEMADYLQNITAGAGTDADKLKAIERELSSFTYTRTPGPLPETVTDASDFLDYFLLESREGYCNYFATAFTLLARAQGIPARFVQGFCVPAKGKSETLVYSNMAHAWPEVYFEGIGWIPFEPTPGYSQTRYASWAVRNRNPEAVAGLSGQISEAPGQPEEKIPGRSEEETEALEESSLYPAENKVGRLLKVTGLGLLLVSGILILLLLLNFVITRYRYQKMSLEAKFKTEVSRNLRILSFMGIRRKEEETLWEFKERTLPAVNDADVLQFLDSYEAFLYGNSLIDPQTLKETKRQQAKLLSLLRQKKKRVAIIILFFYY